MTIAATGSPQLQGTPQHQGIQGRDPHSVYRVTKIVATHEAGWEQAAAAGVAELAKSIEDLRIAQILEKDVSIHADGTHSYRVKLAVSYRIDRRRVTPGGAVTVARRFLVLADQSADEATMDRTLAGHIAAGHAEFHFVFPIRLPSSPMIWGDPMSGYVDYPIAVSGPDDDEAVREAQDRLDAALAHTRDAGGEATGEVTTSDPFTAALNVLERGSFDEIVLFTHPSGISRRLHLDLAHRLARHTQLPISHGEGSGN